MALGVPWLYFAETKLKLIELDEPHRVQIRPAVGEPTTDDGGSDRIARALIAQGHGAVEAAEQLAKQGDHAGAKAHLEKTAENLREGAPGSGDPVRVMEAVRSIRDLASRI